MRRRFVSRCMMVTALALCAGAAAGCSGEAEYGTSGPGLALQRVVLYRNGVGYFERVGRVEGDTLTIKVRKDAVNDLLKSLTVVERGGGRAVSVSMPLDPQSWANAALATLAPAAAAWPRCSTPCAAPGSPWPPAAPPSADAWSWSRPSRWASRRRSAAAWRRRRPTRRPPSATTS
ncbi:MAG: hypothetical protein WKG00_33695 [Polyangiaceae bacterium]